MAPFTRDRLQRGETPSLDELLAGRDTQAAAILRAGGLLAFGLGPDDTPPDAPADNTRPLRLFEKIVRRHALKPGCVRTDLRFIHEYYTGMCAHLLAQRFGAGYRLHEPQQIVCFEDHLSYVERSPVHVAQNLVDGARLLSTGAPRVRCAAWPGRSWFSGRRRRLAGHLARDGRRTLCAAGAADRRLGG